MGAARSRWGVEAGEPATVFGQDMGVGIEEGGAALREAVEVGGVGQGMAAEVSDPVVLIVDGDEEHVGLGVRGWGLDCGGGRGGRSGGSGVQEFDGEDRVVANLLLEDDLGLLDEVGSGGGEVAGFGGVIGKVVDLPGTGLGGMELLTDQFEVAEA